ncbi:hypothetical protein BS78_10G216800 [Paspalum vaginatum]|nr:hypothetical protein BS78_10G216800 [Paspalum vaginatum]
MARVLSSRAAAAAVLARRLGARAQAQPGVALSRRSIHTRRSAAEVAEEDAAGTSAPADAAALTRRLEEAIDGAMARMAEPDWAPFRPGTSYFVPPRPAGAALGILALAGHGGGFMGSAPPRRGLSPDEARAVAAASRGYPCSAYFIDGRFPDEVESSSMDANQVIQAQDE